MILTNAVIVATQQTFAICSNGGIPLVELGKREGAVLIHDDIASVPFHSLMVSLTGRYDASLRWCWPSGLGRGSRGWGLCSAWRCCWGSRNTNAVVCLLPQAGTGRTDGGIPLVEVCKCEGVPESSYNLIAVFLIDDHIKPCAVWCEAFLGWTGLWSSCHRRGCGCG